jgi:hypothetical protein
LREISTGNYQENKIKRNIYNRFTGSLELLKESVNLSLVEINNTDIDSGLEYLNLDGDGKAIVYCSADERPNCRVKVIEEKLSPYQGSIQVWKRANSELVIVALCKQLKKTKEDKTQLESKLQIEREKFKKFQNKSAEHQQQRENKIKELELENTHLRQQLKNLQLNQEQLEIQIEVNSNKK